MHQIGRVSLKCLQILAVGLKLKKKKISLTLKTGIWLKSHEAKLLFFKNSNHTL